ncbi:predicted protein [Nematostella vectensis]|uniref:Ferroptosis suppressor protein 1 n=1 Tax=Nematostella vectensis TaxID=45351 RepID=A7RTD8_NEMVE|nr:predicted protein [Nematostella vectensis]|eukprot:XP_001637313.1 predicted protein [Nematostella vectensis]
MGSSSSQPKNDFNVIIVGGGYAGITLAGKLDDYCNVTLIDPKDCFHHSIGALRCVVEPGFIKKTLIPYKGFLKYGTFIQAKCVSVHVSLRTVTLSNGQELSYDYLVFACGSSVPFPGKVPQGVTREDAHKLYEELALQVKNSEKIVIIGGGPVGVELAGEIANDYPSKKVTIVNAKEQLISNKMSEKFQKKINKGLKDLKVNLVLGEKIAMDELDPWVQGPITITTDKGTSIEADLVFRCTGFKVNADAYRSKLSDKMDHNTGSLKVDAFLQVEEMRDVFAIGDCNNTPEIKLAYGATLQAETVAFNIKQLNESKRMKEYKLLNALMVVPMGRNRGAAQLPNGMVFGNMFAKGIKGKDMMTGKIWKQMNQKKPS